MRSLLELLVVCELEDGEGSQASFEGEGRVGEARKISSCARLRSSRCWITSSEKEGEGAARLYWLDEWDFRAFLRPDGDARCSAAEGTDFEQSVDVEKSDERGFRPW